MSTDGYKIRDQSAVHFLTFATVQWVDVFTRSEYAEIIIESLKFCKEKKGLAIHAWCIMPNHLHLVVSARGATSLSDIMRDFKKFTSGEIIRAIENNSKESRKNWMLWIFSKAGEHNTRNINYQFWQQDNHPIECSTPDIFNSKINYLHANPVRAGLVWNEEDYRYSSAVDYFTTRKGLIEIERMS